MWEEELVVTKIGWTGEVTGYVIPPSRRDVTYGYYNMDKFTKKGTK